MALSRIPFRTLQEADAHLDAAANELQAIGCKIYSYYKMDPPGYHHKDSFHYDLSTLGGGRTRALDVNHDGSGDVAERNFLLTHALPIAQKHGLSVTCGFYGYVPKHSIGDGMHMHVDNGSYSNFGDARGVFPTPWGGRPTASLVGSKQFTTNLIKGWKAVQSALHVAADGVPGRITGTALQKALNANPALARQGKLVVDGIIGPQTVKNMQIALGGGLVADGVIGPRTLARMAAAPERVVKA